MCSLICTRNNLIIAESGEELCTLTQVSFRHHVPGTSLERKGHDEVLEIKNVDANAGNKPFHQLDREEEPQLSDRPSKFFRLFILP